MFCKNCGNRIPDNIKFCGKCGTAVSQSQEWTGAQRSMQEEQEGQQKLKLPVFDLKMRVIAVVLLFIIVIIVGVNFVRNEKAVQEEGRYAEVGMTVAEDKKQNHDIVTLNVTSEMVLEGQYENLKSITMSPSEDGSIEALIYEVDATFPVLESLECGAVFKLSDSGDRGYFDEKDFPQLRNVTMKTVNKYIDEDVLMTYLIFSQMYDTGRLQSFQVENSYTIEDLYGTWTDDKQTLTLTFAENGVLRVADANNIIGVDVLKYKEMNDNTLSLSTDQGSLFDMISISMKYELFGKRLLVEISGQEFALTRK